MSNFLLLMRIDWWSIRESNPFIGYLTSEVQITFQLPARYVTDRAAMPHFLFSFLLTFYIYYITKFKKSQIYKGKRRHNQCRLLVFPMRHTMPYIITLSGADGQTRTDNLPLTRRTHYRLCYTSILNVRTVVSTCRIINGLRNLV